MDLKPGWQTSELWFGAATSLATIAVQSGWIDQADPRFSTIGIVTIGLVYGLSRLALKRPDHATRAIELLSQNDRAGDVIEVLLQVLRGRPPQSFNPEPESSEATVVGRSQQPSPPKTPAPG